MTTLDRSNVHLLLVEDNPRYLNELIEWLEEEFGYQHIETASNVDEAKRKLDEKPFDVIVADMRLDGDAAGGFAVLHEKVTERNLTSVIIILTANDTVEDCRRAFKEGAWDYLSKSMKGNVFEELDQSILEAIRKIEAPAKSGLSIADLIREGESSTLEFLASFRWDVKEKRPTWRAISL